MCAAAREANNPCLLCHRRHDKCRYGSCQGCSNCDRWSLVGAEPSPSPAPAASLATKATISHEANTAEPEPAAVHTAVLSDVMDDTAPREADGLLAKRSSSRKKKSKKAWKKAKHSNHPAP